MEFVGSESEEGEGVGKEERRKVVAYGRPCIGRGEGEGKG